MFKVSSDFERDRVLCNVVSFKHRCKGSIEEREAKIEILDDSHPCCNFFTFHKGKGTYHSSPLSLLVTKFNLV